MDKNTLSRQFLSSDLGIISALSLVKLVIHFLTNGQYGYFRDELYYLTCGERLDWGYVDQPPLIAVVAKTTRWLFGDSLFAIRFFPAVAGALKVFLTGLIVRELGGGRFAQLVAGLAVIIAPIYLGLDTILTMNAFEPLFWMTCAYLMILIVKGRDARLWLLFGLVAGVGLLNKHSMAFFAFALGVGLILTPERRVLLSRWLWLGGLVALVVFLPHLIWQIRHDWPMLELLENIARSTKNTPLSPLEFFLQQILILHPFTFPIWLAGLYFYLVSEQGQPYRALGWTYLVLLVTFVVLKGKIYYLVPAYPMLLASGAVMIEGLIERYELDWLKSAQVLVLMVSGAILAPLTLPVLPVESFIRYADALGIAIPRTETHKLESLPQYYADMFGWEQMAATVAKVYHSLPPEERAKAAIFAQNYGEAGAIDFFGRVYNLPKAISGHQNYFYWGPRDYTGEIVIVMGDTEDNLKTLFDQVEQAVTIQCGYCIPYENNLPVFVCRRLKMPLKELWPKIKKWI